ncbi:MAG: DUF6253 family protein [Streptosporangiaceae bacterium]
MIPATQHYARFGTADGRTVEQLVVAWNDEGHGLVLDRIELRRAMDLDGFLGFIAADVEPVIAVAPGGGWLIEFDRPDGAGLDVQPVIGWAVRADGVGHALGSRDEWGNCECAAVLKGYRRVYHPDHDMAERP